VAERAAGARRVGVIGHGAIGSVVARSLAEGFDPSLVLAGVVADLPGVPAEVAVRDVGELIERSDIVVEAASHGAVQAYGARVLEAGVDLLVVSVGALVDDDLRQRLVAAAGDRARLLVSSGAIGGLDLLRAAAALGPLDAVTMTSTKPAANVIAPWMDDDLVAALRQATGPVTAFEGSARDAARAFPASANVAATLGLSTLGLDAVRVRVLGDPAATTVRHVIEASGPTGRYEVGITNVPSPLNSKTSAVTPGAVLRALRDLGSRVVVGA
jgi:aspartate dehydrogenase